MRILLILINYILYFLGLRIVKFSKFGSFVERLIKQAKPVKFINIGTSDGVRFDSLYLTDTDQRWSGLVVEPLPDIFERLKSNYKDYPDVIPINIAFHPTESFATICRVDQNQKWWIWKSNWKELALSK
jgi:hypothetical protein